MLEGAVLFFLIVYFLGGVVFLLGIVTVVVTYLSNLIVSESLLSSPKTFITYVVVGVVLLYSIYEWGAGLILWVLNIVSVIFDQVLLLMI